VAAALGRQLDDARAGPRRHADSEKQPGVLYVGTGGRGVFVFARDVSADLVAALLACERGEDA